MWNEIVKAIAKYESSVLSFVDAEGFPLSVRCVPQADGARQVIRVQLPPEVVAQPGPASLMSHHHDAQLWNLHGYSVVGELAREEGEGGWVLRPQKIIPGMDSNPLGSLRLIRDARRAAQRYLDKRNLPRPQIDWSGIKRLHAEARNKGK
ncbi:MAG: hypothetical protein KA314_13965 [Chloroflexi bacterium]|nr:hypothetical protein [Chloroflexota bacterium]MBP8056940.1 hypothetical protein [Chloroflexota bacterium]